MNRTSVGTDGKIVYIVGLLLSAGIKIWNVRGDETNCVFDIMPKDVEKCKKVLLDHGKKFEMISDRSPARVWKTMLSRAGLFVGFVIIAIIMAVYSLCVTRISVSGNETISSHEIEDRVRTEISLPIWKNKIDNKKIKTAVCLLPGVSEASVSVEGNSIFVSVLEELPSVKREEGDAISKYDALVTKIVLYEGTPETEVGKTVKAGETVIKAGESGVARGEVYGRIWLTEHIVVPLQRVVTYRTGRKEIVYTSTGSEEKYSGVFSLYEAVREEVWFPMVIPIKMRKTTYFEIKQKQETVDFEMQKEELIEEAFARMESRLPSDAQKVKKWFFIKTVDKTPVLDLYYETEVKVNE